MIVEGGTLEIGEAIADSVPALAVTALFGEEDGVRPLAGDLDDARPPLAGHEAME